MNENSPGDIAIQAQQCLVTGQFERAKALFQELCSLDSDNEEMWLMLAVAQAESGALEDAVHSASRAIALDRGYAEAFLTRAHILKKLGHDDAARQSALDAVEVDDEYTEAWMFLAGLAGQSNNPTDAETWASKVVELAPDNADAYVNLANAQYELGKLQDAGENYQHALRLQPSGYLAKLGLAKTYLALKEYEDAENPVNELLQRNGADPEVLNCLAHLHLGQGRTDKALELLQRIIDTQPKFKPAYHTLARLHYLQKDIGGVIRCLASAREQFPDHADILYALGYAHKENGQHKLALECFETILAQDPANLEMRLSYASILSETGDLENALSQFEDIAKQHPDDERAVIACANLHDKLGNYKTARELLLPIIEAGNPPPVAANAYGQICHHFNDTDRSIDLLKSSLENASIADMERRTMLFTLGKLYDRCGDHDAAFELFREANELKPCTYDHDAASRLIDRLIAFDSDALLRHRDQAQIHDHPFKPVFIVGMPRSGTSLVEQIIASHPHVAGLGERPELTEVVHWLPTAIGEIDTYPECMTNLPEETFQQARNHYIRTTIATANGAPVITDKMPSNFQHLPLILRLFPNARIIHCRRNPLDTCLSIYFQEFGGRHDYAYQLHSLGQYYREYDRLMKHYRDEARIPMLEVEYENIVNEPERFSREMIEYCGLEWDEACLAHYHSSRVTRTASYSQVREPIYKRSVNRWKHYEKHIGKLKDALGCCKP